MKCRLIFMGSVILFSSLFSAEKKVFAHYMGGEGAGESLFRIKELPRYRHDKNGYANAMGGIVSNFPLTPPDHALSRKEALKLDLQRAQRAGFDGFVVDAWAGANSEKNLDLLFQILKEENSSFLLTICLDPNCHPDNGGDLRKPFADSIRRVLKKHGTSPNLARRNGKPLIFTYQSRGILRTKEQMALREGPDRWKNISDAWKHVEQLCGEDLFLSYDFDLDYHHLKNRGGLLHDCARWAANHFDAVGGFTGMEDLWSRNGELVNLLRNGRAEWCQPVVPQYSPAVGGGGRLLEPGMDALADGYKRAAENGSALLHVTSWNDYVENTAIAPGYHTNYALMLIHKRFADQWKKGSLPSPEQERIFLFFFRYCADAEIFPFYRRFDVPSVLEVVTDLREDAIVEIPSYGRYSVKAGLTRKQFPLKAGPLSGRVIRNGKTVVSVTSKELVTERPYRNDFTLSAISSDEEAEWKTDFPGRPYFQYSEYSDRDGDGLPDWFEMYYFGQRGDVKTSGSAAPDADPDRDGLSNLREFEQQSDPTKQNPETFAGIVWNLDDFRSRPISFNPDSDQNGLRVWRYCYRIGSVIRLCPNVAPEQKLHLSPYRDPRFKHYQPCSIRHLPSGGTLFSAKIHSSPILRWKSPTSGTISISGSLSASKEESDRNPKGTWLILSRNRVPVFRRKFSPGEEFSLPKLQIPIRKGDFLDLEAAGSGNDCGFTMKTFQISQEEI